MLATVREVTVYAGFVVLGVAIGRWGDSWSILSRVFGLSHQQQDRRHYERGLHDGYDAGFSEGAREQRRFDRARMLRESGAVTYLGPERRHEHH